MKIIHACIVEALLTCIYFAWRSIRHVEQNLNFEIADVSRAALLIAPLLILNAICYGPLRPRYLKFSEIDHFADQVIFPFVERLKFTDTIVLSIAAGIGEELFFRGVLQHELGIVLSSVLFSVLHFGRAVRTYPWISVLYFLLSAAFGVVFHYTESLPTVILAHAGYDFVLLTYLRRLARNRGSTVGARPMPKAVEGA